MSRLVQWTAAMALLVAGAMPAKAHFVWIDVKSGQQSPHAEVYFSETPEPGEPHLIDKVAGIKTWVRTAAGQASDAKVSAGPSDSACLQLAGPVAAPASVEGYFDYGVYGHGGPSVLLHYYAKHLAGDWAAHGDKLARAPRLACDIIPSLSGSQLTLTVLYNGQPSAGCELAIVGPGGKSIETKSDANGKFVLEAAPGHYAVRAGHIEADRAGQRDGKDYAQTWHYATATFDVGGAGHAASELSAAELLKRARDGRAIWANFPGFTADVTVEADGQRMSGSVAIDANGNVALKLPQSAASAWVEEQLRSQVQHRMPDGEVVSSDITYVADDRGSALGRLIDLGDPSAKSQYRIKDDVIWEVNRMMGDDMRFTISVLEIVRNQHGKYLPRAFSMNFFDAKSGQLRTSLAYRNDFQHVDGFDLPSLIAEISAQGGKAVARQIELSNFRLEGKK